MIRTVLLTGTRAPATLDLARRLWREGVRVIGVDSMRFPLGRFSRAFSAHRRVPPPRTDLLGFLQGIAALAQRESVDLIWPTCEEVFHLAAGRELIESVAPLWCSKSEVLEQLHHKLKFARWAGGLCNAVAAPESWDSAEAPTGENLVWKPCYSRFAARTEFKRPSGCLEGWMAQRFVAGREFSTWALCVNGQVRVLTQYLCPARAGRGAGCAFEPYWSSRAQDFTQKVAGVLGYTGSLAFDFIEAEPGGKTFVLECNPRLTSGLHLLDPKMNLLELLAGACVPLPPPQQPAQLLLPVLCSAPRLASARRDVIALADDPGPALTQWLPVAEFLWKSATRRVSVLEATTIDIEFNGD